MTGPQAQPPVTPSTPHVVWECSKPGCEGPVRPDGEHTQFDARYTTGKCKTHGKVVLVTPILTRKPPEWSP